MKNDKHAQAKKILDDPRWQDILNKNPEPDIPFVYCVLTTGIYCRPSCSARFPKPENILFKDTWQEAEQSGFRACQRCRPNSASLDEQNIKRIVQACRLIETSEEYSNLKVLAAQIGLSEFHFHRLFKKQTSLTPKQYADLHKEKRLRHYLTESKDSVTHAIYNAGYGSSSRVYEKAENILGMLASQYKKGGKNHTIHFAIGTCRLGEILVAQTDKGICAISLGDDEEQLIHKLQDMFPEAELIGGDSNFENTIAYVIGFIEQPKPQFNLPLDIQGSAFQKQVWLALQKIPIGQTISYQKLAEYIGYPKAVRAVANACAANKLAVAIPCHRVIRTDGAISGYRWGIERKKTLLEQEKKQSQ
ncbi:bifunctional DNA-binding transcriptional regulator/O6-methylguanine-DNA methyltransferase Ada [Photorhabdus sp. APURE]|uniref:bifunctional DNA-binding transcriptional regulator/O6-methylguanine-DNA methyltransferase Ada n=1 Tax=Photorhabdus aballayi TaxID=2991723 RepID=UPI00223CAC53|nr:bifunctional DNA-binding transcriptional regulator/O6-methylguanine-DNA methyltransferase Ada [Photorhabdus aballayi]MCW7546769.1 bifunctional DNA-binding transcriptional regulator/O6-methylguanine-DNA methyltransferase Ada [Photorhabdus aballayi]